MILCNFDFVFFVTLNNVNLSNYEQRSGKNTSLIYFFKTSKNNIDHDLPGSQVTLCCKNYILRYKLSKLQPCLLEQDF